MTHHRSATAAAVVRLVPWRLRRWRRRGRASPVALRPLPGGARAAAASKVSFYAASRFAEQVSFGATPALVAEIQAKGYEKWIDDQFALPIVPIDIKPAEAIYAMARTISAPGADELPGA